MQKTYFVIPSSDIWNNSSTVESVRRAYDSKEEAIDVAKNQSREYNADFIVCAIEVKVSTLMKVEELE